MDLSHINELKFNIQQLCHDWGDFIFFYHEILSTVLCFYTLCNNSSYDYFSPYFAHLVPLYHSIDIELLLSMKA